MPQCPGQQGLGLTWHFLHFDLMTVEHCLQVHGMENNPLQQLPYPWIIVSNLYTMLNVTHGGSRMSCCLATRQKVFTKRMWYSYRSPRSLTQKLQSATGVKIPQGHLTTVKNLKSLLSFSRKVHWNSSMVDFFGQGWIVYCWGDSIRWKYHWSSLNSLLMRGFPLLRGSLLSVCLLHRVG